MNTSLKKENKPLLVGLTGGIGSGKSTVAKVFKSLGVPIFNSDTEAKKIINNDEEVIKQITAEFGAVYENGKLNFPTITIGSKKLRNPYKEELYKWLYKLGYIKQQN